MSKIKRFVPRWAPDDTQLSPPVGEGGYNPKGRKRRHGVLAPGANKFPYFPRELELILIGRALIFAVLDQSLRMGYLASDGVIFQIHQSYCAEFMLDCRRLAAATERRDIELLALDAEFVVPPAPEAKMRTRHFGPLSDDLRATGSETTIQ